MVPIDYQTLLSETVATVRPLCGSGKVADYIPALAQVPSDRLGMALATCDGALYTAGDAEVPFSIQSISKMFTLMLAMEQVGDKLWERVGLEPSGNPFNSLVQLEWEHGIPRNPFINAGALVISDHLVTANQDPKAAICALVRDLSGNAAIDFDPVVAASEAEYGYTNYALANYLKAHDNLVNDVEDVLDVYFHQCALTMSCTDLARAGLVLASRGHLPGANAPRLAHAYAKRITALMMTCGLYDAVGNFAYHVGLPAKSGVGGGILAVLPGDYSVAVWSPALDPSGNSSAGGAALEYLTERTGCSIF